MYNVNTYHYRRIFHLIALSKNQIVMSQTEISWCYEIKKLLVNTLFCVSSWFSFSSQGFNSSINVSFTMVNRYQVNTRGVFDLQTYIMLRQDVL